MRLPFGAADVAVAVWTAQFRWIMMKKKNRKSVKRRPGKLATTKTVGRVRSVGEVATGHSPNTPRKPPTGKAMRSVHTASKASASEIVKSLGIKATTLAGVTRVIKKLEQEGRIRSTVSAKERC